MLQDLSPEDRRAVKRAILRRDFNAFIEQCFRTIQQGIKFVSGWYIEAISYQLELCRLGQVKRLIICAPPRSLKSVITSVAYHAWLLGHDPSHRIISATYANELTAKHARDFRLVLESGWYRELFPRTRISASKNTELEVETTARGSRLGTSISGTLTGKGAQTLVLDDLMKAQDANSAAERSRAAEWLDGTLFSRLDDQAKGCIILVMHRLHVDDPVAHLIKKGGWTVLSLPAFAEHTETLMLGPDAPYIRKPGELLDPVRLPAAILSQIRGEIGEMAFAAQYQQAPVPPGGALLKWAWFKTFKQPPAKGPNDRIVLSWDTAWKEGPLNDFTVCTVWHVEGTGRDAVAYLIHVYRERIDYPTLKRKVVELRDRFRADAVLIEESGSGIAAIRGAKAVSTPSPSNPRATNSPGCPSSRPKSRRDASTCPRMLLGWARSGPRSWRFHTGSTTTRSIAWPKCWDGSTRARSMRWGWSG